MASVSPESTEIHGALYDLNRRLDQSLEVEGSHLVSSRVPKSLTAAVTLSFAFQSLGIVYGDLGTSPLYVYRSIFPHGFSQGKEKEELMGALSLIIYTLILIPLIKYTFIVMRATDNGEGGTFALYSLICRHAKTNTIPNQHPTDQALTTYSLIQSDKSSMARKVKKWLEESRCSQRMLVILVLVGTSMLIGDGILTPAISVLSSVGGIKVNQPNVKDGLVVGVACIILLLLFSVQRFGTDKVGWFFAPTVFVWLVSIGVIGIYNTIKHDYMVLKAFSPVYIIRYFASDSQRNWVSLGGVLLSITGTEAFYADVGHFSVLSVQIAFGCFVFPCLLAAYVGQAAYLSQNPLDVQQAFYESIPKGVYWPMFVIGTLAAIIASQATISATFSIIKQSVALGCFPRVKVVHTSQKHYGQVYIPEINWILMVLCIIITAGFKETVQIGNAYGIAVVLLMVVTTILMGLVMLVVWRTNFILTLLFTTVYLAVELILLSAMLFKFDQGGWAPLAIAALFLLVMYTWHYGTLKKYEIEKQNKVPLSWILGLGPSLGLVRVPGIGLIYSELAHGVPSIFSHFMTHLPAIHSVVVFVCIKYLPVNRVPPNERFLFRDIGPKEFHLYRCVARYGYQDLHKKDDKLEESLLDNLARYIKDNSLSEGSTDSEEVETPRVSGASLTEVHFIKGSSNNDSIIEEGSMEMVSPSQTRNECQHIRFGIDPEESGRESEGMIFLHQARQSGVVHILGDVIVKAKRDSNVVHKFVIDYVYALLRRICRENSVVLNIPHESLFNIGQVYYL